MPRRNKIQVNFQTSSAAYFPPARRCEHRIAVYPAARDEVLWEWHRQQTGAESRTETARLAARLADHWLAEFENCRRAFRFLAAIDAGRTALKFNPSETSKEKIREVEAICARLDADWFEAGFQSRSGNMPQAIALLEEDLGIKPDLARVHGKLGTLYAMRGETERAVGHLQQAAQFDRDDPYGPAMLGWLAYLGGRPEEALAHYRVALEIEPWRSGLQYTMGLVLQQLDETDESIQCFQGALEIDPRNSDACQALSEALRQRLPAEALRLAQRAVQLTRSENALCLLTLAECCADAGRFADAENAARQALSKVPQNNPQLAERVESRLSVFRGRSGRRPHR